jgi:hypothetical protein
MSNTKLWASSDYYETDTGKIVGRSLAEAVAWARENPDAFARTYIWWVRDDDAEAIIVDRDIRDELEAEAEQHSTSTSEAA